MQPLAPTVKTNLPGLTGLRGIGAIWVLVHHAQYGLDLPVAGAGFLGVDMFFILSGFVLSHAAPRAGWTWSAYATFLRNRVARIFPLHLFALALLLALVLACPSIRDDMPRVFEWPGLLASAALVQNWGFTRAATWNLPAWSLSTEWLVSLAFPVFLLAAARVRRPGRAIAAAMACLAAFAAFLALTGNPGPDVTARAGLVRTVLEFASGCLLHRAFLAGAAPTAAAAIAALALVIGAAALPGMATAALFGFPVIILLAAQPAGVVARTLSRRPVQLLGELSFSIYLLHWPLLQVSTRLQAAIGVRGLWGLAWFAGFVAVVLALSAATYTLVEMPARRRLRAPRPAPAAAGHPSPALAAATA